LSNPDSENSPYSDEQISIFLYTPQNSLPPYQTIVYCPGVDAWFKEQRDLAQVEDQLNEALMLDYLTKSGRAVVLPNYKGTFGRDLGKGVHWVSYLPKDLSISIDYLETRGDIDTQKLAFFGFSTGALLGPILTSMEDRFRASVLLAGGLYGERDRDSPWYNGNFSSRVKVPTLMLNGRKDFLFPIETSAKPMFEALGVSEADKRLVLFDSGHIVPKLPAITKTLDWLDRYLGPVELRK
jgi:dipeptidyl aminopeptidase/acylaminoacyl peptidase